MYQEPCQSTCGSADRHDDVAKRLIPGTSRAQRPCVLTSRNTRRRVNPTLITLVLAMAAVIGPASSPASRASAQVDAQAPDEAAASLPDAAGVVSACLTLHRWVEAFDAPDPDLPEAALPIENATAVYIALRQRGRVLGSGRDAAGDAHMVRRAAGRAMSAVLGDRTVASLPEALRGTLGDSLTTEFEVAGTLVPLPGRSFARIAEVLEPGLDGVAMRRGDVTEYLFPAEMRTANTTRHLGRNLPALAVALGLPAEELSELTRRFDVRMYRFRTIHLVQRGPGRRPFETFRGDVVVPQDAIDGAAIDRFAAGLTDHLITTLWAREEPLGLMGDYRPSRDDYTPLVAPPRDQALVAFALARYAAALGDDGRSRSPRDAAEVVLVELTQTAEGEIDPLSDPVACAAIIYAVTELPGAVDDPRMRVLFDGAVQAVVGAFAPTRSFAPADTGAAISEHGQSMIAGALARCMRAAPDRLRAAGVDADLVRDAINAAWGAVPDHRRIALLPWIAFAEADDAEMHGRPLINAGALRMLRTLLNSSRIGAATSHGAPDLAGGFPLQGAGNELVTAQTTRPAAFIAWALRQPDLTGPGEVEVETGLHLRTMRFLRQLSVDDDLLWSVRAPLRAKGGLRAAPWDSDQPVAAQAMGLLTAAETLVSLRQEAPPGPPPGR